MYCGNCGNNLGNGDKFCGRCGSATSNVDNVFQKAHEQLNKDTKNMILYAVVGSFSLSILISFIHDLCFELDIQFTVPMILITFGVGFVLIILLMFKSNFKRRKTQLVINSRFTDDKLLEQNFIQLLNKMNFAKDSTYEGNVYYKNIMNKSNTFMKVITWGSGNNYIKYQISGGKIYLEVWLRQFGKNWAVDSGSFWSLYKKQFIDELSQMSKYFDF